MNRRRLLKEWLRGKTRGATVVACLIAGVLSPLVFRSVEMALLKVRVARNRFKQRDSPARLLEPRRADGTDLRLPGNSDSLR